MVPEEALNKDFYLPDLPGVVDISRNWGGVGPSDSHDQMMLHVAAYLFEDFLVKGLLHGGGPFI